MRRQRDTARYTDSAAHRDASSSRSAYTHQNSEGDKFAGIADGHANTATSRNDGQQRSPTYSQPSRLRTTRSISLCLTLAIGLAMHAPMGATAFAILAFVAITAALIGIGATLLIWTVPKR